MLFALARNWQLLAFRGVATLLFGMAAIAWPGITLSVLVSFFGVCALLVGLLSGTIAFSERPYSSRVPLFVEAIAGILAGISALAYPGLTEVGILYLIGAWALVTGGIRLFSAILEREKGGNAWLLGLDGLAVALLGLMVVSSPSVGALIASWTIGAMALAFGLAETALAFRLRHLSGKKIWLRITRVQEKAQEKIEK